MAGKILIIDDERSVANFLTELFEIRGYDPVVFYDSKLAMQAFEQDPDSFDLVVTDQTMPAVTGAELSMKILSIRPGLPIILCTGYSEAVNEEIALGLGVRHYINKPIDIDDLLEKVDSLVSQ
ncbi:MAG: response regulator [Gammaproteobacteria bacterium]|nr:response regulator [Gammaproteobacteria bacterium]